MTDIKHTNLTVTTTAPDRLSGERLYVTNCESIFDLPEGAQRKFTSRMTHERPMTAREFQQALSKHADNVLTMLAGNLRDCIHREVAKANDAEQRSFASQLVLPNGSAVLR